MKFSCFKKKKLLILHPLTDENNHKKIFPCFLGKPLSPLPIFAQVRVLFTVPSGICLSAFNKHDKAELHCTLIAARILSIFTVWLAPVPANFNFTYSQ